MRRLISAAIAVFTVTAGAMACQRGELPEHDESTRSEAGAIIDEGELGVFALAVGDCLGKLPTGDGVMLGAVQGVRCDQPHDGQVYGAYDVTMAEYPGDDVMFEVALDGCLERVPATIHDEWTASDVYVPFMLQPNSQSWKYDDREVICVVVRTDGRPITGDLLGSDA